MPVAVHAHVTPVVQTINLLMSGMNVLNPVNKPRFFRLLDVLIQGKIFNSYTHSTKNKMLENMLKFGI
jgi:hypothetical protein